MSGRQTTSAPFSVIDELLGGPRSDTAATSLIRRLLEAAANEAKQSHAIDESILRIDENGTDDAAWAISDKYVKDIQKLESFLLELGALSGKTGAALELDNVSVCQGSIRIWEANRTRLHTQLQKLRGADAATQAWEQKRDDAAMFQMMVSKLEPVVPTTPPDSPMLKALQLLKSLLARVKDDADPPHSDSVLHGIKAAWLMCGAIAEKDNATTTADRKYHLGHDDVWNLGQSFAEKIVDEEIAALVTAYGEFLGKLSVRSTPPRLYYAQLTLASKNVTAPFLLRTNVLVESCRELVKLYADNESIKVNQPGEVIMSLEAVKAAAATPLAESANATKVAFAEATRLLIFALNKYSAFKGLELDTKMNEAITGDEARLVRLLAGGPFHGTSASLD